MAKSEHLKELGEALLKGPPDLDKIVSISNEVIENYYALLQNLDLIITKAGLSLDEALAAIDMTKVQYYRRRNNPGLWKKEEIQKLLKTVLGNKRRKKK